MTDIKKIGVIGAGQMGAGIAQVSAAAGYEVILSDISLENAKAALAKIDKSTEKLVAADKLSAEERKTILANIAVFYAR